MIEPRRPPIIIPSITKKTKSAIWSFFNNNSDRDERNRNKIHANNIPITEEYQLGSACAVQDIPSTTPLKLP